MTWKMKLKEKPYKLYLGDCLKVMRSLPSNSVDCICTDGPYALKFMLKAWDSFETYDDYLKFSYRWAKQAFRVLKPGGYLLSFSGTKTYHWMAVGICRAGFVCRDMISWLYGSGFPHGNNISKSIKKTLGSESKEAEHWIGYNTTLKPAQEPIGVFQKEISEPTIAKNCLKWGTGAINIDAGRVQADENLGRHNKVGKTTTLFDVNRENHSTDQSVYVDNSSAGRYPANIIHDGSKEVLDCFPQSKSGALTKQHQIKGGYAGTKGIFGKAKKGGDLDYHASTGSAGRFFYCAKPSTVEKEEGLESWVKTQSSFWQTGNGGSGKPSSIEKNRKARAPKANDHVTVKPILLMEYLCSIYCPHNGIVLDPFLGSGTTGIAAIKKGKRFIGIEKDRHYCDIATQRINHHYHYPYLLS